MKTTFNKIAFYLVCLTLLPSCFSTYESITYAKTYGDMVPIEDLECSTSTPEDVDIFYEGDSLNFEYKNIGFVTAFGVKGTPDLLIMHRLKYNSYLLCGNGVTNIIKTETIKEGTLFTQFSANSVRIKKDSLYYSQYPPLNDFSFYNFSKNDLSEIVEKTEFRPVLTTLALGASAILVIIKAMNPKKDDDNYEESECVDDGI